MNRFNLLGLFLILWGINGFSQDSPDYYVQFKVNSVGSEDQAKAIDKKMEGKKGILSTHTDYVTSTYFCTMTGDAEYIFDDFETWFEKMGYEIVCFNKGIRGDGGMMSPHVLKKCEESNTN
jgi:hypothetical protein